MVKILETRLKSAAVINRPGPFMNSFLSTAIEDSSLDVPNHLILEIDDRLGLKLN